MKYIIYCLIICIFTILFIMLSCDNVENMSILDKNIRILNLVLYSDDKDYNDMYEITREYYKKFKNVRTIYYKFSGLTDGSTYLKDDILYITGTETYVPGILDKTIKAFTYFQNKNDNYDYVIRTNISTIVNFDLLLKELKNNSISYGGGLINNFNWEYYYTNKILDASYQGTVYASGTAIIMSWDFFIKFLSKKEYIDYRIIDDVAIGILIKQHFPNIIPFDIGHFVFVDNYDENIIKSQLNNTIFYRNRTENRSNDVITMKKITAFLL